MTAPPGPRQPCCRPHQPISEAQPRCPGQPDRAEPRSPSNGVLDSAAKRSYPYTTTPPDRPAECGLIHRRICGVKSDTRHSGTWLSAGEGPPRWHRRPAPARPPTPRRPRRRAAPVRNHGDGSAQPQGVSQPAGQRRLDAPRRTAGRTAPPPPRGHADLRFTTLMHKEERRPGPQERGAVAERSTVGPVFDVGATFWRAL
jgi:hypothetical protein